MVISYCAPAKLQKYRKKVLMWRMEIKQENCQQPNISLNILVNILVNIYPCPWRRKVEEEGDEKKGGCEERDDDEKISENDDEDGDW